MIFLMEMFLILFDNPSTTSMQSSPLYAVLGQKYRFLFLFLVVFSTLIISKPAHSQSAALSELKKSVANMQISAGMENASYGVCIMNASTGDLLAQHDMNRSLITASCMKLITTATALNLLGENYTYKTVIEYDGEIKEGVLYGNLYLKGSGDPSLGSERWGTYNKEAVLKAWANACKQKGIRLVKGKIIGDGSFFHSQTVPSDWNWEDLGNYYGASVCGLNFNENKYDIHLKTGQREGDPVQLLWWEKNMEHLRFVNELTTGAAGSGDNSYIYGAPYTTLRYLRGSLPPNESDFVIKGSVPDPEAYCADLFCDKLAEMGIPTTEGVGSMALERLEGNYHLDTRTPVYVHSSPPLREIVYWTNLKSINLFAEAILATLGWEKKGVASTQAGLDVVRDYWEKKGVPTDGMFLTDGSGLSPTNSVTPYQMCAILRKMTAEPTFGALLGSLPVAGKSGTLANMCNETAAEGRIQAKSGYMSRVRTYAGYATTKSGRRLCFAIFANNYNDSPKKMKERIEYLMIKMAELD